MKIARYARKGKVHYGRLDGDRIERLSASPFEGGVPTGKSDKLAEARLLAPVDRPRLFGVGFNYVAHIKEGGNALPDFPVLFMKPTLAVVGPDEPIVYPREGKNVHFEGELAVVMGKRVRRASEAEALDAVLGYTCANDISERVIQFAEMKYGCLLMGKGFDSFCPVGPVIATGLDPGNLELTTRVNGAVRQRSSTADLLFGVPKLVSYISSAITLLPGDVIITGTPAGVGPVVPGDVVEVEIEGIGILRNPVVAEG